MDVGNWAAVDGSAGALSAGAGAGSAGASSSTTFGAPSAAGSSLMGSAVPQVSAASSMAFGGAMLMGLSVQEKKKTEKEKALSAELDPYPTKNLMILLRDSKPFAAWSVSQLNDLLIRVADARERIEARFPRLVEIRTKNKKSAPVRVATLPPVAPSVALKAPASPPADYKPVYYSGRDHDRVKAIRDEKKKPKAGAEKVKRPKKGKTSKSGGLARDAAATAAEQKAEADKEANKEAKKTLKKEIKEASVAFWARYTSLGENGGLGAGVANTIADFGDGMKPETLPALYTKTNEKASQINAMVLHSLIFNLAISVKNVKAFMQIFLEQHLAQRIHRAENAAGAARAYVALLRDLFFSVAQTGTPSPITINYNILISRYAVGEVLTDMRARAAVWVARNIYDGSQWVVREAGNLPESFRNSAVESSGGTKYKKAEKSSKDASFDVVFKAVPTDLVRHLAAVPHSDPSQIFIEGGRRINQLLPDAIISSIKSTDTKPGELVVGLASLRNLVAMLKDTQDTEKQQKIRAAIISQLVQSIVYQLNAPNNLTRSSGYTVYNKDINQYYEIPHSNLTRFLIFDNVHMLSSSPIEQLNQTNADGQTMAQLIVRQIGDHMTNFGYSNAFLQVLMSTFIVAGLKL